MASTRYSNKEFYRIARTDEEKDLATGSFLVGEIRTDWKNLVFNLGFPSCNHEDYEDNKIEAEWIIQFSDGTVATVYNYCNGKRYDPDNGLPVEQIRRWHVGGTDSAAVEKVGHILGIPGEVRPAVLRPC